MAGRDRSDYGRRSMTIGPLSHPPIEPHHERLLVARSAADPAALAELHDAWLVRVHAFVARRVWERRAAEIVVAATFARVFGAIRRDGLRRESFGGLLYRTATAILAERARIGVAAPGPPDGAWIEPADGDTSAGRLLAKELDRDGLGGALLALPPAQRRLLVLAFLDGLEPDELCAVLECSRSTLAVRLRRALRRLADAATQDHGDAA
jgi:RNA polymerase sigma-70 factor (ECF subfamily)